VIGAQARGRTYERRVDHDAIRAQRAAGATYAEVARTHGISDTWAKAICEPEFAADLAERQQQWAHVPCENGCGRKAWKTARRTKDGRTLCVTCRSRDNQTRFVRDAEGAVVSVRCRGCHEWNAPDEFTRGDGSENIHSDCRTCQTKARKAWREKNRERDRASDRARKRAKRAARRGEATGATGRAEG
jgi:hypothetical protein